MSPARLREARAIASYRFRPTLEVLEERNLLTTNLTAQEQLLLELINRGRANPSAEAALFGIALNEGLAAGTISTAAKQPLAPNQLLINSIRGQLSYLLSAPVLPPGEIVLSHIGSGGSTFGQRIAAAGYSGAGAQGENLAVTWTSAASINLTNATLSMYQGLFVDSTTPSRGHRINLLNNAFKEVGPGVVNGPYNWPNPPNPPTPGTAAFSGQDFATRAGNSFLTGVFFTDAVTNDNFYTVGEGMGGITVTATPSAGPAVSDITGAAGGYAIQLAPGTYTITAAGTGITGTVSLGQVTIGSINNIKLDFAADTIPPTVATAASASPNPVTGTTTNLSVLGADDGGEAALTYTWAATTVPSGATPGFGPNGTNAAKNTTVTFNRAGAYILQATIRDASNLTITSSVNVTVNQTLTSIVVSPVTVNVPVNSSQQFTATARDQFSNALTTQPAFSWSVLSGPGSINPSTGFYTTSAAIGTANIQAASGAINGTATANVSNSPPNTGDFDKDGNQDIVWRQSSTGDVWIWRLNRTSVQTTNPYIKITTSPPGTDWQIVGKGDFDRDGNVDLLWRQTSSGQVWIWRMNGTALQASNPYMFIVNSPAGSDWQVVGVGDFDKDGFQDIVWRQTSSGQVWIWRLNGTTLQASNPFAFIVNSPAGSDWQVVGVGDFDQDNNQDILWRQTSSGQVWIWRLNGTTLQASNPFVQITTSPAGSDWQIADVGDYDQDGNLDLLWRHAPSGQVWIWRLNRTALQSINPFVQITTSPPGIDWQIV